MSTLHLTQVEYAKRALVIRAVREALRSANGGDDVSFLEEAEKAVYSVLNGNGPYGLVQGARDVVDKAAGVFLASLGPMLEAGMVEVDMEVPEAPSQAPHMDQGIEEQFAPENMPAEFSPSQEAVRTALTLMAACDGSAQTAWFYSKLLARSTGNVGLFVEVGRVIADTFTFQK